MNVLSTAFGAFALLLLAAHHLRAGDPGLTAYVLGVFALLLAPCSRVGSMPRWVAAGVLACGLQGWIGTGLDIWRMRLLAGQPALRPALIMGSVALFTLVAAALLVLRETRREEREGRGFDGLFPAALFLLVSGLLLFIRARVPFPVLLLDRYLPGWGGAEIFCLGVYAAWVGSLMRDPARARRVRPRIWALFSFVFFAQLGLGLAGLDEMLMTGRLHLPVPALIIGGPLYRGGGLFMPLLFGGAVLLAGPAWCSHLCYIGAWDDRMSRLGKTAPQAESASSWAWGRWATLGLVVITALGLRLAGVSGPVAVWLGAGFGLAGVGVMVLVSRRRGVMAHCAAWCPMGLVAALLGRINPFRVRLGEGCTGCGACARACRYGALDEARIDSRRPGPGCTLCGDCVGACPRGSAGYAFPGLGPRAARELFLLVVITLHAVFLGVARI